MSVRLSATRLLTALQPWAEVELPMQRRLAHLANAEPGREVLWIGCGSGRSVLWWCERFGTHTEGVDPDASAIETAERAARNANLAKLATFQVADAANLPHEAAVFDTVIVNMLYLPGADGAAVIREAARVARPMATVIALAPSWLEKPDAADAAAVASFGIAARLVVEWKSLFRDAGVVELSVEDAARNAGWLSHGLPSLVLRGWHAAGWSGVRAMAGREVGVVRRLAKQRVLGFSIVKGSRWPHADDPAPASGKE